MRRRGAPALLVAASAAGVLPPSPAAAAPVQLTAGVLGTRGAVGEQAADRGTQLWWGLRWRPDPWTFGLDVPWVRWHDGTGRAQGLGDVTLRVSRELREAAPDRTGLDLTLKLKAATGDVERGLGTGGTDALAQLEFIRPFGPWLLVAEVGWRATGNAAGRAPYANPWHLEFGALAQAAPGARVGLLAYAREPIGRLGPRGELTLLFEQRRGSDRWRAQLSRGNGRASPPWSIGLSWTVDVAR